MGEAFEERRRTPRVKAENPLEVRLGRSVLVRVVELSATGVLLRAQDAIPVGTTGQLTLQLGSSHFAGAAEITRDQACADGQGHLFGAVLRTEPRHRHLLEEFLDGRRSTAR